MKHIIFEDRSAYPIAILVKANALHKGSILQYYVNPLEEKGVKKEEIVVFDLEYPETNITVGYAKTYLGTLEKPITSLEVKIIYVADAHYFKVLTSCKKVDPYYGYALPGTLQGYQDKKIVLGVPYSSLFYNPALQEKLDRSITTVASSHIGTYNDPGIDIFKNVHFPSTNVDITQALAHLATYPVLACDIETFSLRPSKAGIGTIAFAWSKDSGVAFAVDARETQKSPFKHKIDPENNKAVSPTYESTNFPVRKMLKTFFEEYKGTLLYHGVTFDAKVLAYQLFMDDKESYPQQLDAVDQMTANFHCTKIISYLATNNCIQNKLSLKELAQEHCGNWAQDDIEDICKIPLDKLLKYNLVDALGTFFVYEKYYPIMVQDNQLEIYETLFKPLVPVLINAELNGMPMKPDLLVRNNVELEHIASLHLINITSSAVIQKFNTVLQTAAWLKKSLEWKKKTATVEEFAHIVFNPASNPQLQQLLFNEWGLPVLSYTDKKQPAVGSETLQGLLAFIERNHKIDQSEYVDVPIKLKNSLDENDSRAVWVERCKVLHSLIQLGKVSKITGTFFKAFLGADKRADGYMYLQGNFNTTGTKSGRLSSSDPNMQNLPATGTVYAKKVKECFMAPPGWLMAGADFRSLEDMISALTTKDPNKLKVYTGHIIYEVWLDGVCHHIRDDDIVEYDGKTYTGETFYATYSNSLL